MKPMVNLSSHNKVSILSLILFFVGVALVWSGSTLVPSGCPGLGCNYLTRSLDYLGWFGLSLTLVGFIVFFEGLIWAKTGLILKVLFAILMTFVFYLVYMSFFATVFIWG